MNIILFDANSTSPVSGLIAVAPGECILINAWGLDPGETAQVFRAYVALGEIPESSGVCEPPKKLTAAQQQSEVAYLPCNVTVAVGETVDQNLTSLVLQQPGFYRVHLSPSALGTAVIEGVVLKGAEACSQAASQCCCVPETFFAATSTNPCLVITPGGEAGHRPTFSLDACCLLHAFPGLPNPVNTDELVVLSGGQCFRSTIAQVFDPAIICTTLGSYLLQLPLAGDTLVVVDAGANCKRVDGETFVEFFETPWTGISVTPALTIAPGGINGHGPTFAYDLCADLQAIPACACEPVPGDLVPIIQGGACVLAQWPEVDACTQMGGFAVGALVVGDTVFVREAGGACKQVPAADFASAVAFPLLAPDGTCAAPSYSFASSPDSGMFYNGTAVVIGDDNCTDFIEIGASINITSSASNVIVQALNGGAEIYGGSALLRGTNGPAVVDSVTNQVQIESITSFVRLIARTQLEIVTGLAALNRLFIDANGAWLLAGVDAGTAGRVITSNGAGTPPTWQTVAGGMTGFAIPSVAADAAAATAGVATTAIRSDAKLQVATGAPTTAAGTTNSIGVATSLARSDHLHRIEVGILEAAVLIGSRPFVNFTGNGVGVADNGGLDRVDVDIPGFALIDSQTYIANDTWNKPAGAVFVVVDVIGGGGGGGGGRGGAAGSVRQGGGGGGGGARMRFFFLAGDLLGAETVTVGAGGLGGAGGTNADGSVGSPGGESSFGGLMAFGGGGGGGGSTSINVIRGGGGGGALSVGMNGSTADARGGAPAALGPTQLNQGSGFGGGGAGNSGLTVGSSGYGGGAGGNAGSQGIAVATAGGGSAFGGAGGGAGGGVPAGNTEDVGRAGGASGAPLGGGGAAGAANGGAGGVGANGNNLVCGDGGGGGGSQDSGGGGSGGDGGIPAGGGGGGGGGTTTGGDGGDGARGEVRVYTFGSA